MKTLKLYLSLLSFLFIAGKSIAQAPQGMNYQAIARDAGGLVVPNKTVTVKITITNGNAGSALYAETDTVTTNQFGLFTLQIGEKDSTDFSAISWGNVHAWMQVSYDPNGGNSFSSMGTSQLLSVPYALFSGSSNNSAWAVSGANIYNVNTGNVGVGTVSPLSTFEVRKDHGFGLGAVLSINNFGSSTNTAAALDFNTYDPQGNDPEARIKEINNGNQSGDLTFSTKLSGNKTNALSEVMRITADGNVGVGSNSPLTTLEVRKDAANALGPVLTVSNFGGGPGSSSAIDFNTYSPAGSSSEVHIAAVDDGNHSDNLTFNIKTAGNSSNSQAEVLRLTSTGKVGINNAAPVSTLQVSNGAVLFDGSTGGTPVSGAGSRMMWVPAKNAFRAGSVDASGTYWDDGNIGSNSVAFGSNTIASGASAVAIGYLTVAHGDNSFASGQSTTASGASSSALGSNTTASGASATAIGYLSVASGDNSFSAGQGTTASGASSTAFGTNNHANGPSSTALGYQCIAGGDNSLAAGQNCTVNGASSIAIGDGAIALYDDEFAIGNFTLNNNGKSDGFNHGANILIGNIDTTLTLLGPLPVYGQIRAHAPDGYILWTDLDNSHGVILNPGDGSWSSLSDRRKKANFQSISPEEVLQKIGSLPITQWNYTSQPTTWHHIGPMAQDFFAAFHLDGASDTTINSLDIDGVNMAGIQALKVRTDELKQKTDELEKLNTTVADMRKELNDIKALMEKEGIMPAKNVVTSSTSDDKTK